MWEDWNVCALLVLLQIVVATMVNNMRSFSKKLKIELQYNPANFSSGYFPKENKSSNSKRYRHSTVHCSIVYKSQDLERI